MALLRRTRRKGLVLLAIICLSSSTLLRICIQGEKLYRQYNKDPYSHEGAVLNDGAISPDRIMVRHVLNLTTIPSPSPLTQCDPSTVHCAHLLSTQDTIMYKHCTNSAYKKGPLNEDLFGPHCRFMDGSKRRPIGLVSFPGSGNTWVRGLLQLATGICTGSIYCDRDLRRNGFSGEGLHSGSVLVTKTHRPNCKSYKRNGLPAAMLNLTKVILIIRNPFHAIISERNRQSSGNNKTSSLYSGSKGRHVAMARKEYFGDNQQWNQFVVAKIKWWYSMIHYWLTQWSSGPVLVISYEEIKHDAVKQVKRMLSFINYTQMSEGELTSRLKNGFDIYHRKHPQYSNSTYITSYYTHTQRQTINQYILSAHQDIAKSNYTNTYNVSLLLSYVQK